MKRIAFACWSIVGLGTAPSTQAQGTFQNLDFEQAQISTPPPGGGPVSQLLPHWQASENGVTATQIAYDTIALTKWAVTIQDVNGEGSLSGKYSVFLQGGKDPVNPGYAEISQIGTMATDTHSILFAASMTRPGNLNVAFNGQQLQTALLQDHSTYQTFGADVSAFAGQTGELSFTAPDPTWTLIDNIQFSTAIIPEPTESALILFGAIALAGCIGKRRI